MCLTVLPRTDLPTDVFKLSEQLVGRTCYVGWPYLVEAMVWAVSDGRSQFYQDSSASSEAQGRRGGGGGGGKGGGGRRVRIVESVLSEGEFKKWRDEVNTVTRQHLFRHGVILKSVDVLVYAQVLQGKRYILDRQRGKGSVCLHKEWAPVPTPFPCSTVVLDIAAFAPEFRDNITSLEELFPPKCQCFIISTPYYGSLAEVLSVDLAQLRVHVRVQVRPEPVLNTIMTNRGLNVRYLPSYVVAQKLDLSPLALARITGSIQVERGSPDNRKEREKLNIGLNWKFSKKNKEIPGYARKSDRGWTFSSVAVELLKSFMEHFPQLFNFISANPKQEKYYESDLFEEGESPRSMSAAREWLKHIPSHGMDSVDCDSETLDTPQIAAMEKAVRDMQAHVPKQLKTVKLRVKSAALFKPIGHQGNLIPDPEADYELFDRVVNVSVSNAVPFGLQGTVIGILGDVGTQYEIVFDEEFLGGLTLRCSPNRAYRLPASCLVNISYGKRLEATKDMKKNQATHQAPGAIYSSAGVQNPYQFMFAERGQMYDQQGVHTEYVDAHSQHDARRSKSPRNGTRGDSRKIGESFVEHKPVHIAPRPSSQKKNSEKAATTVKSSSKSAAASDFSSMMYEMEAHSKGSPKSHHSRSKDREQQGDEFGKAMQALTKLKLGSNEPSEQTKSTKEDIKQSHHQEKEEKEDSKPTQSSQAKELTPSVAAMFDSFSTNDSEEAGSEDPSHHDKPTAPPGKQPDSSPPERIPDAIQKLMRPPGPSQPPHRSPLLPNPAYYQPRVPIRGPLLPRYPQPMPFGPPPPPDPITMLHHISFSVGEPMPKLSVKETQNGMFIGLAEIGKRKYKGVPSTNPEDAKQSAAAAANANLMPSSLPPHPLHSAPPYGPPPPPRPLPHYRGPPPYQYPPPMMNPMMPHHPMDQLYHSSRGGPKPPPPFAYPSSQPSFVPLQVQRRQMHKSPVNKPAATGQSKPEESKAKRNIIDALNTSLEQESPSVLSESRAQSEKDESKESNTVREQSPDSSPSKTDENDPNMQSQLLKDITTEGDNHSHLMQRVEAAYKETQNTKLALENISQLINVLGGKADEVGPNTEEEHKEPVPASDTVDLHSVVGDAVVSAAIVEALTGQKGSNAAAVYSEATQPSDSGEGVDPGSITVVGEILSRPQTLEDAETSLASDHLATDQIETTAEDTTQTDVLGKASKHADVSAPQTAKAVTKKPKIQLAASFMHS